ncbi:unnamed protein product [Parajaminaea phylloscopi]
MDSAWVAQAESGGTRTSRPVRLVQLDALEKASQRTSSCEESDWAHDRTLHWSETGEVSSKGESSSSEQGSEDAIGWALPYGLAHPHIHLDKCFLLDHDSCRPPTQNPRVNSGGGGDASSFQEALQKTGEAKRHFTREDLLSRGRRLLRQSLLAGVTAARCHVEVDPTVEFLCLDAGLELKAEFQNRLDVRLSIFAQDPVFSYSENPEKGEEMRRLLKDAAARKGVSCIGSAPYVESDRQNAEANVDFIFQLAEENHLDLDFHSDYDLDADDASGATLWYIIERFRAKTSARSEQGARSAVWNNESGHPARLALGHCTRISTFDEKHLAKLSQAVKGLDIHLIGLPTSDVYIQGRESPWKSRPRATLPLLELRKQWGIQCSVGLNNVGNLFTPQACVDPLVGLLPLLVALYQTSSLEDLALLLSMVTRDAHAAIGSTPAVSKGGDAALWQTTLLLPSLSAKTFAEFALDPPLNRTLIRKGKVIAQRVVHENIL